MFNLAKVTYQQSPQKPKMFPITTKNYLKAKHLKFEVLRNEYVLGLSREDLSRQLFELNELNNVQQLWDQ